MQTNAAHEECVPFDPVIQVTQLARAYVPNQRLCTIYRDAEAIKRGTVFPDLDKPYVPRCKGGEYDG